jgi:hypothetical protein
VRQKTIDEITRCLQHAREAVERAAATDEPNRKASYLDMAQRWKALAKSFEIAESLGDVDAIAAQNELARLLNRQSRDRSKMAPPSTD